MSHARKCMRAAKMDFWTFLEIPLNSLAVLKR